MDKKYFVPFTTARRLKEMGYNVPSNMAYNTLGKLQCIGSVMKFNYNNELRQRLDKDYILAPTYHEVLSWLEGKGVAVCADKMNGFWYAMLVHTKDYDAWEASDIQDSREQALNCGINWALDYLQIGEKV